MIIDDEHDDPFDENHHTVTTVVRPTINYNTPFSLAIHL
jgi:hypothetical protein